MFNLQVKIMPILVQNQFHSIQNAILLGSLQNGNIYKIQTIYERLFSDSEYREIQL